MTRPAGRARDVFLGVFRPGVVGENEQLMVGEISQHETAQASVPGAQAERIHAEVLVAQLGLAIAAVTLER